MFYLILFYRCFFGINFLKIIIHEKEIKSSIGFNGFPANVFCSNASERKRKNC